MKVVLSTALSMAVALAGSVALAQSSTDESQDQVKRRTQITEEELQTEEQLEVEEQETAPYGGSREGLIPSEEELTPAERDEMTTPEREGMPVEQPSTVPEKGTIEKKRVRKETTEETAPYAAPPPVEEAKPRYGLTMGPKGPGFELMVGGGIFDFSKDEAQDVTSLGGMYTARVGIGTHMPVALELAYVGSSQNLTASGLDSDAFLLANGAEGVARINLIPKGMLRPYVLGGAGWKRYTVVNEDFNTSSIREDDDVLEIPVGAGVSYHFLDRWLVDARGEYRFSRNTDLILGADDTTLDNWDVNIKAGVEF